MLSIVLFAELSKEDRDEKSVERKEKDRKTIRRKKISSLKRQISLREKQLEVTINPTSYVLEILTRSFDFFTLPIFNTFGLNNCIKSKYTGILIEYIILPLSVILGMRGS